MDKTAEHSYTTARTLLSILRLAQALARLAFREVVDQARPLSLTMVPLSECVECLLDIAAHEYGILRRQCPGYCAPLEAILV